MMCHLHVTAATHVTIAVVAAITPAVIVVLLLLPAPHCVNSVCATE
jgi:hypothetical protein